MMKLFISALLLVCCSLRADLLDDTARLLDIIERDYWSSQRHSEGDYRKNTEKYLQRMFSNINRIQAKLTREGKARIADITSPASTLQRNYGVIKVATIRRFPVRFKGTAMRNYTKEHKALYMEKAARQEEKESAEKKDKKSKKSRRVIVPRPTLANVDLVEYERWLADITSENADKFQRTKNNGTRSEVERMNTMVSEYFTAIRMLRIALVKIRQNTKIEFK